jgi:hypothetical protein
MSMNPSGQSSTRKTAVICRLIEARRIRVVQEPRHARAKTAKSLFGKGEGWDVFVHYFA